MTAARVLRSTRVVVGTEVRPADLVLEADRIRAVEAHGAADTPDGSLSDLGDLVVLPGLIDAHVHINEPGRTHWEGFACATRAAARGGFTTLVDMPLNSEPVTVSVPTLERKVRAARGKCRVDVAFHGGLVPGNADDLATLLLLRDAGVAGFKAFLCDSGLASFPPLAAPQLERAMRSLALLGLPLLAHAELVPETPETVVEPADRRSYRTFACTRPPSCERRAVELLVELSRRTGCSVHVVHVSAGETVEVLRAAREEGLPITAETCPHYLLLTADEVEPGDTRLKCAPPLRTGQDRDALWSALDAGVLDFVASDHSPAPPQSKRIDEGDFLSAWGGIASLQLVLPLVWTEARRRGHSPADLARWLATAPADRFLPGLAPERGRIEAGARADLTIFDPDAEAVVHADDLEHRHPVTPYLGRTLRGAVRRTLLGGRVVFDGDAVAEEPAGQPLLLRTGSESSQRDGGTALSREALERCCGARAWVDAMCEHGRLASFDELLKTAERAFLTLGREDWLEAFAHHPRIGDLRSLRERFGETRDLAAREQASAATASEETLEALAEANCRYSERFGYVFIVCATGKSAERMLALLRRRLHNAPDEELRIAAQEQRAITRRRLARAWLDREPRDTTGEPP